MRLLTTLAIFLLLSSTSLAQMTCIASAEETSSDTTYIPTGATFEVSLTVLHNGVCPAPCEFELQAVLTPGSGIWKAQGIYWSSTSNGSGHDDSGPLYLISEELGAPCSESFGSYDEITVKGRWYNNVNGMGRPWPHDVHKSYRISCASCTHQSGQSGQ